MDKTMVLKRTIRTELSTIGELYMPDGSFQCFTLEDVIRTYKIPCKTAIPSGAFEVIINWSNRFNKLMPRVLGVPFYQGVLIHTGNTIEHTEGCILVGKKKDSDKIYESMLAFEDLFPKIRKMCGEGKLFLEIQGGHSASEWTEAPNAVQ
jgi:hypothetical protein